MNPRLITWARERASLELDELAARKGFKKLPEWEAGRVEPTRDQLYRIAEAVHIPEGYLYLSKPPDESLEIIGLNDFRTVGGVEVKPSPDLYAVIYACQRRQAWFREYADSAGLKPHVFFTGAKSPKSPDPDGYVKRIASDMAAALGFGLGEQEKIKQVDEAMRRFMKAVRDAGVLVIRIEKVGNKEDWALKKEEFLGFALSDPLAPLVFINGADSKSAQMLTLAHELVHLWLGDTGISSVDAGGDGNYRCSKREAWCNRIASEFLVPMEQLTDMRSYELAQVGRKAASLHVSRLVIVRRLHDDKRIDKATYADLVERVVAERNSSAEDVTACKNDTSQTNAGLQTRSEEIITDMGDSFVRAVIASIYEGETQYTEAISLLDAQNTTVLSEMEKILGCDCSSSNRRKSDSAMS